MRFKRLRRIRFGLLVLLCCCPIAFAQKPNPKSRAQEILDQTCAALGGNAVLQSVQSLSAFGDFRSGSGRTQASGDFQLDILLPDKVKLAMKWSLNKEVKVTAIEAMNGRQVWRDSKEKYSNRTTGFPPIGGTSANSGEPSPNLIDNPDDQQIWSDFSCLIISLLFHLPDSTKVEIRSDSNDGIIGVAADFLKIDIGDDAILRLAIDQKTHLPFMAAYVIIPQQEKKKENTPGSSNSETVQIQIYFSGYKPVSVNKSGDLWLPHQITKTRNGITVEDMHITKFQLNPRLKPKQFEQKHS